MRTTLTCAAALSLVGCSTTPTVDPNYIAYVEAIKASQASVKPEVQLLRIKAKTGETITLGGVEELVVNMPANQSNGMVNAQLHQRQERPSEALQALGMIMPVVGAVGGIWAGGQAATNLVNAVGVGNAAIANSGFKAVSDSAGVSGANLTTVVNGMNTLGTAGIAGTKDTATAGFTANSNVATAGFNAATAASNNLTTLGQSGLTSTVTVANSGLTGMGTLGQAGLTSTVTAATAGLTAATTLGQAGVTGVTTVSSAGIAGMNTLGTAGLTNLNTVSASAITNLNTLGQAGITASNKVCTISATGVLTCL